jgi:hypothetical protein
MLVGAKQNKVRIGILIGKGILSLNDYLFWYLIIILGLFSVLVFCNAACEYRNYRTGHRYIKSFKQSHSYLFGLISR